MNIALQIVLDINRLKAKLRKKVFGKKNVPGNFGNKEVKELTDKYHSLVSTRAWDRIIDFELWCKGFGQTDLRGS